MCGAPILVGLLAGEAAGAASSEPLESLVAHAMALLRALHPQARAPTSFKPRAPWGARGVCAAGCEEPEGRNWRYRRFANKSHASLATFV